MTLSHHISIIVKSLVVGAVGVVFLANAWAQTLPSPSVQNPSQKLHPPDQEPGATGGTRERRPRKATETPQGEKATQKPAPAGGGEKKPLTEKKRPGGTATKTSSTKTSEKISEREQLQSAQQKLQTLGYEPGTTTGRLNRQTRKALEAFQKEENLPATGRLDPATLAALGLTTTKPSSKTNATKARLSDSSTEETSEAAIASPTVTQSPLYPVLDYLRFYETQPARLVPHTTESFRGGMSPQAWIEYTVTTVADRGYSRLAWEVQSIDVEDEMHAMVYVLTRIRVDGQKSTQQEVFSLVRENADDTWAIDAWQSEQAKRGKTKIDDRR
jgi:peptidoglycan hydrolase-like protein with peptidoglycan-binding domain